MSKEIASYKKLKKFVDVIVKDFCADFDTKWPVIDVYYDDGI